MKTKMKSHKSIMYNIFLEMRSRKINRAEFLNRIFAVIVSATSIAILDSCEALDEVLYAVNEPKCNGCKKCLSVCPENAISIVEGKAVIDKEECIGCGRCLSVCSEKAIYAIPESE